MLENQLLTNGNNTDSLLSSSIENNLVIKPELQQIQNKSELQQSMPTILNNNLAQFTNGNIVNNGNSKSNQTTNTEYSKDNANTSNSNTKVNDNVKESDDGKIKEVPLHVELRK